MDSFSRAAVAPPCNLASIKPAASLDERSRADQPPSRGTTVHKSKKGLLIAAALTILPAGLATAAPYDAPQTGLPDEVQSHIDQAYLILKGDVSVRNLPGFLYLVDEKAFPPPVPASRKYPQPTAAKAFDQFYYLGDNWVNAWALNTRDGIIVFDTLTSPEEASQFIEGGLRKVGLDPKNIKYVVITHGHPDHLGGAKYLQEKYHAKVAMSAADWDIVQKNPTPPVPVPARDISITDGQKLTLGGATLSFYLTPGHTPGTVSTIFPVTDHGRPHVVSFVGGTGLPNVKDPSKGPTKTLRESLTRFAKVSLDAGADVVISSHPFNDDAYEKAKLITDGKAKTASPFVSTPEAVLRYYTSMVEAVYALEAFDRMKLSKP